MCRPTRQLPRRGICKTRKNTFLPFLPLLRSSPLIQITHSAILYTLEDYVISLTRPADLLTVFTLTNRGRVILLRRCQAQFVMWMTSCTACAYCGEQTQGTIVSGCLNLSLKSLEAGWSWKWSSWIKTGRTQNPRRSVKCVKPGKSSHFVETGAVLCTYCFWC